MLADEGMIDEGAWAGVDPFEIVGVGPQVSGIGNAVADGVGVNIAAEMEQVVLVGDLDGVVGTFKESASVARRVMQGVAVDVENTLG